MNEMFPLMELVKCFEQCAASNAEIASFGSEYARGKSVAFEFAAKWLRREIEIYEKKSR